MKDLLSTLQEEFREEISNFEGEVKRETVFPEIANKIMVAIGMRRTGKTYFLWQKIRSLLEQKIDISQILYLNFEDDRLSPVNAKKLGKLIDTFYTLFPENHDRVAYLFLDEIQNVENWPLVVRRFFDTKKVKIYLSGSSAKLLSKEISTVLRGRSLPTEVWPFSFTEYLVAHNISAPKTPFGQRTLDHFKKHLYHYLMKGGFPEITATDEINRIRILQDYVNVVIFRDIIERYKITNIVLIKYMIRSLLKQISSGFSVNKFFNDLKSQGFSVAKTTIHEYLSYIEDAYLVFTVPLYSESLRKTQVNLRKVYAVDTGLVNAYSISFSENLGRLFENLIFLDLKRKRHDIYYYLTKNNYEIDFLTRDIRGKLHLYQVVWDIEDKETLERELRALKEAEKELNIKGELITPQSYLQLNQAIEVGLTQLKTGNKMPRSESHKKLKNKIKRIAKENK